MYLHGTRNTNGETSLESEHRETGSQDLAKTVEKPLVVESARSLTLIHYTALAINAAFFIMLLLGSFMAELATAEWTALLLDFSVIVINVVALCSNRKRLINSAIALNSMFMLRDLLVLFVNPEQVAKIGAGMEMVVSGFTIIALLTSKEGSLISLYLARKRLEERKKIEALQREQNTNPGD